MPDARPLPDAPRALSDAEAVAAALAVDADACPLPIHYLVHTLDSADAVRRFQHDTRELWEHGTEFLRGSAARYSRLFLQGLRDAEHSAASAAGRLL